MAKNDNLGDYLTDIADAIREKKGSSDAINAQSFSDEIRSIQTSSSIWTGHVDVEGLKAIGWDDNDIAYFQEHGVNWMEEDDEYHKVSEDNKALYGIINEDNYKDYTDIIEYMPKIQILSSYGTFLGFKKLRAVPNLEFFSKATDCYQTFTNCHVLTCIPPITSDNVTRFRSTFEGCFSLLSLPPIKSAFAYDFTNMCRKCCALEEIDNFDLSSAREVSGLVADCFSLKKVSNTLDVKGINVYSMSTTCQNLMYLKLKNLSSNLRLNANPNIGKDSILFIIENEAVDSTVVIELNAHVYERLAEDPDIVAALANHPLVSLGSE